MNIPDIKKISPSVDDADIAFNNKTIKTLSRVDSPVHAYFQKGTNNSSIRKRREVFDAAEYDLYEVGRLEDVESYVRQAFKKKLGLFLKEGFDIIGANKRLVKYTKIRFQQIAHASGIPHEELIRRIASSLIRKSNAFLVKVRDVDSSGGKIRIDQLTNKELEPIAGYFPAPPETMELQSDGSGRPLRWRQQLPSGLYKEFRPEDVIHFTYDRKEGFLFGTPLVTPVIDDIRALRKIEENIELLIYKHLFPMFQYIVGTETAPATINERGEREIDVVKVEIQHMPSEGAIVTPERHEIRAIGAENQALRAEVYLEHFRNRVFSGLGMSAVDFGLPDTSNKCFSEDTQVLTNNGWKYHWEVNENDTLASLDPVTHKVIYEKPTNKFIYDFQGKLHAYKNRNIDLLVTPNHKLYIGRPLWGRLEWELIESQNLDIDNFRFLQAADWQNLENDIDYSGPEYFEIDKIEYKNNISNKPNDNVTKIKLNDWLEFIGYFISEGCSVNTTPSAHGITIGQNYIINKDKYEKIKECFDRLPFKYNEHKTASDSCARFWIYSKSLKVHLKKNFGINCFNKRIPREYFNLPKSKLKILLDALMVGDGSHDNRNGRNAFNYSTASMQLANDVQELALRLGYKANLCGPHNGVYRVLITPNKTYCNVTKDQFSEVEYSGKVFCFEVRTHILCVRRNGKLSFQGNSTADNMSRALVDDVKDLQDAFEAQFNALVIKELLLESNFNDDILMDENFVGIKFREIDIEKQIKVESHAAELFNKNILTHDEAREAGGRDPLDLPEDPSETDPSQYPAWFRTFWKMFDEPKTSINAGADLTSPVTLGIANSRSTNITPADVESSKKTAMELEKQKGAIAAAKKPKVKDALLTPEYESFQSLIANEYKLNKNLDLRTMLSVETLKSLMKNKLASNMYISFVNGFADKANAQNMHVLASFRKLAEDRANISISRLFRDIQAVLLAKQSQLVVDTKSQDDTIFNTNAVFDALKYRVQFIEELDIKKSFNLGQMRQYQLDKVKVAKVELGNNACKHCKNIAISEIDIDSIADFSHVLPHHVGCQCTYRISKNETI